MTEKVQQLQEIFASLGADPTFVERQTAARGSVRDERAVDAALAGVVAAMRERFGFRTTLDGPTLVAVVRGYYAGRTDAEIATRVDASSESVTRARVNLHLFRPEDTAAPFDVSRLRQLLEGGANTAEAADELGVNESTVGRYAHVLRVQDEARRTGYRYPEEFEELLGVADDARLATTFLTDRRNMNEVVD